VQVIVLFRIQFPIFTISTIGVSPSAKLSEAVDPMAGPAGGPPHSSLKDFA